MNDEGWRIAYNDENYVVVNRSGGSSPAWLVLPIVLTIIFGPLIMDAVRLLF